jgi:hypothetical protein
VLAPPGLVLCAVFLTGALTIQVPGSGNAGSIWLGGGEPVFVTAHIIAESKLQADGPGELHQRIGVETEKIELGGRTAETRFAVRLSIYSRIEDSDSP